MIAHLFKEIKMWESIETAPKDGTRIDLWACDERYPDSKYHKGHWCYWGHDSFGSMDFVRIEYKPTHWMPLPEPPNK